jgi:hypothetical protein
MTGIAKPSVQSLLLQMSFGDQALATGTGFVAELGGQRLLITNRHNVTGRHQETGKPLSSSGGIPDRLQIMHNVQGKLGQWSARAEALYSADSPLWIEHPGLGAKADLVGLRLTELDGVDLFPYQLDGADPAIAVGPADALSVIGFPFGLTAGGALGVWATGFMASEPVVDFGNLPVFLIDCRTRQGQSGSPVIAYRNGGAVALEDGASAMFNGPVSRLLGVYSGRVNAESDLGLVWKVEAIRRLFA